MIPPIADLMKKYRDLTHEDIIKSIELAMAKSLSKLYGFPFVAEINDSDSSPKTIFTGLPTRGEPIIVKPENITARFHKTMVIDIEDELARRQAVAESVSLKTLRGQVIEGYVVKTVENGGVLVEMDLSDFFREIILLGICPKGHQPRHEMGKYCIGERKDWFVTSVLPIKTNDRSQVLVRLSRTSTKLPEMMLREKTGNQQILCTRRIPGGVSWITTKTRIPKSEINSVGKELREHLNVTITNHGFA